MVCFLKKIAFLIILLIVAQGMISCKEDISKEKKTETSQNTTVPAVNTGSAPVNTGSAPSEANKPQALPKLVDLGAGKCIPCKMMAPILEELKEEYKGRMEVVFLDVWQEPKHSKEYRIRVIPTQIFYDASGKELFRHEGFFSKEEILKKWQEFGIEFGKAEEKKK